VTERLDAQAPADGTPQDSLEEEMDDDTVVGPIAIAVDLTEPDAKADPGAPEDNPAP